ncbi:hypothetical protein KXV51_006834 [Aspergillus fumigatus]|nr:hypothetical protein KXV51_006834 [Aspergillus fumigatus]KAH2931941.1 hypothetical protein KXW15_007836 [Aspergillus fumigatus]
MHTSTIEPSSSLLAFIRQSGRPKGPSSAMKLVEVILLALSSDIHAQLFACGLDHAGSPILASELACPRHPPPCLSQYPMQCVPVPQQYGALNCICSGNSGIYQGGDYLYPPPLPPPPPRPARRPKCRLECVDEDYYYYPPMNLDIGWPEYIDYYRRHGHCRQMHPASDTRDMATPGRDREDGDYGDGQYAQPGHYQGDMDDDWSIRTGRAARALERGVQTRGTMGTAGAAIAPDTTIRATA